MLSKKLITVGIITTIIYMNSSLTTFATIDNSKSLDDYWYPGKVKTEHINILNDSKDIRYIESIDIKLNYIKDAKNDVLLDTNSKQFNELSKYVNLQLSYDNQVLYDGTLEDLILSEGILMKNPIKLDSNNMEVFDMEIVMDEKMGNDAQALTSSYSISYTYKVDDSNSGINEGNGDEKYNNNNEYNKIPQTGDIFSSMNISLAGLALVCIGYYLNKKSNDSSKV